MFRKSVATVLALWLPLSFAMQGCGRAADPIDPSGNIGNLKKDLCSLRGGDTDGDLICDMDEASAAGFLIPPITNKEEKEKCVTNPDCNGNGEEDGKEGWAWAFTPFATAVEGFLLGAATIWVSNGFINGNWNPFKHKDAASVQPAGVGSVSFANEVTIKSSPVDNGDSEVKILPKGHSEGKISILTKGYYSEGIEIKSRREKLLVNEIAFCLRSSYQVTKSPSADPTGQSTLQYVLDEDFLKEKSAKGIRGGAYDVNAITTLCNDSDKDGIWIAFKDVKSKLYSLNTLPLTMVGFKPTTGSNGGFVATSNLEFIHALLSLSSFTFVDADDPSKKTGTYEATHTPGQQLVIGNLYNTYNSLPDKEPTIMGLIVGFLSLQGHSISDPFTYKLSWPK